ncbi:histidine kinase [Rhodococcus sp. G-MC3]|uniref:sensor histidine kinase n=1 Tax=Rhodococcus sp. G-MC3 TaxID=3046209 RepID=UPI0024BAA1F4|nr:histidine kinase [Rhodococcus sp. G-MC3]MDJ0395059.1 histidine kinase [Rhodococcus sp. G-MC3]
MAVDVDRLIARSVTAYSDLLEHAGSPTSAIRPQLVQQAEAVVRAIGPTYLHGDFREVPLPDASEDIGEQRARSGIHPTQSLRAASLMFEALFPVLVDAALPSTDVIKLGTALEREIQRRLAVGSIPYVDYLLTKLLSSQQDERSRIARDLHDRVAHNMGAALQQLELFGHYRTRDPERAETHLATAHNAITTGFGSTRQLSADLWVRMDGQTLSDALTSYLQSTATELIQTSVVARGGDPGLPDEVTQELYLLLREAVRNAVLHASPNSIALHLTTENDLFRAVITDDGCGFDVDAVTSTKSVGGLASIRERAELLGGFATIVADPGLGTTVDVRLPLPDRSGNFRGGTNW